MALFQDPPTASLPMTLWRQGNYLSAALVWGRKLFGQWRHL